MWISEYLITELNYVYYHENRTEIVGILESISYCEWKRKDSYI